MISGSTPNADANAVNVLYPNELRLELYTPPYLVNGYARPTFTLTKNSWGYGELVTASAVIPSGNLQNLNAVLITNGLSIVESFYGNRFVTHSVHMGQRMVGLNVGVQLNGRQVILTLQSPPLPEICPPVSIFESFYGDRAGTCSF